MKQRRPVTPESAQIRLETLCARSEHCSGELLQKLRAWGVSPSDSERILQSLRDGRFVDDRRFASAFVRDRLMYSGYGRRRIALALAQKRVDSAIIREALAEGIDSEAYATRLEQLLEIRATRMDETESWESRNKLYKWAVGRGFESDVVVAALKKALSRLKERESSDEDMTPEDR